LRQFLKNNLKIHGQEKKEEEEVVNSLPTPRDNKLF